MDLNPFNYAATRATAVVLGAGATRGASFVQGNSLCRPPLDIDFFQVLRSGGFTGIDDARKLLDFVATEFDSFDVGMETFYSQAKLYDEFVGAIPDGSKGRRRNFEWGLKRFRRLLPLVFQKSVGSERCAHHDRLASAAHATDTFISFNYDCVIDRALVRQARRRWDPVHSYGVDCAGATDVWRNHEGRGRFPTRPVHLLKPHGSLNWRSIAAGLHLRPDEYEHDDDSDLTIVPPLWQKSFDVDPYKTIWGLTRRTLATTKALLVVGYSLPETDVFTQATLRMDVERLDFLCIVNPDRASRRRVLRTLRSAVTARTHLVELETMSDLGSLLPAADDEASPIVDGGSV